MTANKKPQHMNVVIIGAGMVGSAIACGLGIQGVQVALIDQHAISPLTPYPELRVSALSKASEHLLKHLGAWEYMTQQRMTPYQTMQVWEKLVDHPNYESRVIFDTNTLTDNEKHVSELGFIVENKVTQLGLHKALEKHNNVTLHCPVDIQAIDTTAAQPLITLSNGQQFSCDLLIGADGAHSKVRSAAGIDSSESVYAQKCMVAIVEINKCQQSTWQAFTPTGPEALLPLPDIDGRSYASLVWYHNADVVKSLMQLQDEAFLEALIDSFPSDLPPIIKLIERGAFPLVRRHARQYYKNSVVLAGDAAHTINPLAGQGVNLGFQDAAWLIEVITHAINLGQSINSPAVLARYQRARYGDNLLMQRSMDLFYYGFSNDLRPLKLLRNSVLSVAAHFPSLIQPIMRHAMGLSTKQPDFLPKIRVKHRPIGR